MRNIVFFGGGNITQAIIKGLVKGGFERNNIFYIDRNNKNQKILSKLKIKNLKNHRSAKIDLFILAVKPKDALIAYCEILKNYKNPKIVSFVAGIESKKYLNINKNLQFLRAMPNTSSEFNQGITAVFNLSFKKDNLKKVISLLKKVGIILELKKETEIDAFTGMVGSGPAYFFYLLKTYEEKMTNLFNADKKMVRDIMVNLMKGVSLSIENNDLDSLILAVASKKGTTEAGLKSFKANNLNKIFEKGLDEAIKRSKEISNDH